MNTAIPKILHALLGKLFFFTAHKKRKKILTNTRFRTMYKSKGK